MALGKKTPVAFTFVNTGHDWHGGLNYFRSLFLALQAAPDAAVQPVAFIGQRADFAGYGFPSNVRVVRDSTFDRGSFKWFGDKVASKLFGVLWFTNRVLRRNGVSVLSHGVATGDKSLKSIGWIPDFQHVHLPQFFPADELVRRTKDYRKLTAASDLLIVSSESARADLESFAPRQSAKARVLRFCAMPPRLEPDIFAELAATYDLGSQYFYIPNQAWAHKNHLTAVRALAVLHRDYPELKVVCSGGLVDYRNPEHLDSLRAEIARHGLEQRFILLGAIPYGHIAPLMLHSVAVINPSLFEGWSTTVEEAKSLGIPLVLSDIAVHREQCDRGQAAFFDSLDAGDLAARMREKLLDGRRKIDTAAALEEHRQRIHEFALAYSRIVSELAALNFKIN